MKLISLCMILFSGVVYQICSRGIPRGMNQYASLILIYSSALVVSIILFYTLGKGGDSSGFMGQIKQTNLSPFVLGIVITLYELGFILAYRYGFKSSELSVINAVLLMVLMVVVGMTLYQETINWKTVFGMALAITGIIIAKV